jgi:dTDP-glucose 4,6-dehydratase
MRNILITGGAGFIGAHVVRHFVTKYPDYHIVNLDKLTYAGSLDALADIAGAPNYTFAHGDICDSALVAHLFAHHNIDSVIHLAAESHVDRSIGAPAVFAQTNVMGTLTLLEAARAHWGASRTDSYSGAKNQSESHDGPNRHLFYQISTDEVYGALGPEGRFTERSPYNPHSPYSASKAAADHFVRAWHNTYGLPTVISNCTNNYGPGQYPEKLIPLMINNIVARLPLPVYGDGSNVRDWIWVGDHVEAIDTIFHHGTPGETYLAGGGNEIRNIDLVRTLVRLVDEALGRPPGASNDLITFVADRAGHDFRYAADISKISRELGWHPQVDFAEGLRRTVEASIV